MQTKISEVRLTSYALISALEQDFRDLIRQHILPYTSKLDFIHDKPLLKDVSDKFKKDNPGLAAERNATRVIEYLDFQDAYKIILANKDLVNSSIIIQLKRSIPILDSLVPIRNRIMHSRPLIAGDFSSIYNFCIGLSPSDLLPWHNIICTISNLNVDPSFVFSISIPHANYIDLIQHNLPLPDFDESGFIGREQDVKDLIKLLTGSTNVVSLIGDGGIGKTALMLKVAYDIVDMGHACPFDIIMWYSAKTSMLTAFGIQELHNELTNTSVILNKMANDLGAPQDKTLNENMDEILTFMENFKVLLILDNLETVYEESMRNFLKESSLRCKIAITSRIGLGELEYRRLLKGLTEHEAANLVRDIAKMRNNEVLAKLSATQLSEIGKQLHYNPLALKWFVNSVDLGSSPKIVLQNKDDLLSFCLSNVYNKLSNDARQIVSTLLAARKPLNDAELSFITELDPLKIRQSLNQLFSTTLLQKCLQSKSIIPELTYSVSDFAREYLTKKHRLEPSFIRSISEKMKRLTSSFEESTRITEINEFSVQAIEIRNNNERVSARYLQDALLFSRPNKKLYEQALQKVNTAKGLTPSYFEVYRIGAFIKACNNDLLGAEDDYKTALEVEPNNPRLLYFYAGFLLKELNDLEAAIISAKKVLNFRPDSAPVNILFARCVGYSGNYQAAIQSLSNTLFHSSKLSSKYFKISTTLLMDFYKRWAEDERNINKDLNTCIEKLELGFDIFENAVIKDNIDDIILKELSDLLLAYLFTIKLTEDPDKKLNAKNIYYKYQLYIRRMPNAGQISSLLNINYCQVKDQISPQADLFYKGTIIQYRQGQTFAFIMTNGIGNVYINNNSLLNSGDWSRIDNGNKVIFKISKNEKGYFAFNANIYE